MNTYTVCVVLALVAAASAEAPLFGGYGGGGGGGGGGSIGISGGGGGWQMVPISPSGNEGQNVDQQLLEQVRQIVLQDEQSNHVSRPPIGVTSQYGPPPTHSRVVAVELGQIVAAIQKAQYRQQSTQQVPGPYPAAVPRPSNSYGAPSGGGYF